MSAHDSSRIIGQQKACVREMTAFQSRGAVCRTTSGFVEGELVKATSFFLLIAIACILAACTPRQTEDQKFEALAKDYIEKFLETHPEWATTLGDHRFDSRLNDYTSAGVEADRRLSKSCLDSLSAIDATKLSAVNKIDYRIFKTNLESMLYQLDTLREYEWDPLNYNVGGAVYSLTAREFAPLKERLLSVKERLKGIPAVLAAARANLKNPPRIHTETAIKQNPGTVGLIKEDLNVVLDQVPELKVEFAPIQAQAVAALEEYGKWLEQDLLPRSNGDFRIGDEKFRRRLYYSLESDLTKEQVLESATADLIQTQEAIYSTALPLFRMHFPKVTDAAKLADRRFVVKSVLDKLAEDRPSNETIVDLAKQDLQKVTEFVRANNLVTVPEEPLKVVVMPEFLRGVAVAYCDSPGALEKNAQTFFQISPTPKDWSSERVNSFFREYNNHMLQNLTIHEAMPGHYLQLMHANKFKAPTMVRAVFGSGTFIEGWATYAEQFMAEKGYGGPELKMQQLKMRLRLIINAIIDQKIHTAGMTEREAMDMMMNDGFQEEGEAAGKWQRAILTSTQLSTYYVGNMEINGLRKAYEARNSGKVDMKTMHDLMLSFGSPAPRYVKEAMESPGQASQPPR
jgi:uncharacterized protein (DUF885 family)